jgi:23S rRNA (cytosine1962-C5)-methyltransferase
MTLSGLPENAIRWILDDALKFVRREVRRGAKYDAIIMDPPAFGRGAKGEVWKFHEQFPQLLAEAAQLVDPATFRFVIVNAYAVSLPALMLNNMLEDFAGSAGIPDKQIDYGELVLEQKNGRKLSTGIFGRLYK